MATQNNWSDRLKNALDVWTIYFNPSDYPGLYAVRKHSCDGHEAIAANDCTTHKNITEARLAVPQNLVRFNRFPDDDPVIVEIWL